MNAHCPHHIPRAGPQGEQECSLRGPTGQAHKRREAEPTCQLDAVLVKRCVLRLALTGVFRQSGPKDENLPTGMHEYHSACTQCLKAFLRTLATSEHLERDVRVLRGRTSRRVEF